MSSEWEQVLKGVISEILETMFFAVVEFDQIESERNSFEYGSEVELVSSKERILISLEVSKEFARMTTADFLGIGQDEVREDDIEDCMKELANMVGGGYFARSNNTEWRLGIPSARKIDTGAAVMPARPAGGLDFSFSGQPAGLARLVHLPV